MSIISAKEINPITREDIVNAFCDAIMEKIKKANEEGYRKTCLTAPSLYLQDGRLVLRYTGKNAEKAICYSFYDYRDEVAAKFIKAGYSIRPTGYIGGVWQRTEHIHW